MGMVGLVGLVGQMSLMSLLDLLGLVGLMRQLLLFLGIILLFYQIQKYFQIEVCSLMIEEILMIPKYVMTQKEFQLEVSTLIIHKSKWNQHLQWFLLRRGVRSYAHCGCNVLAKF